VSDVKSRNAVSLQEQSAPIELSKPVVLWRNRTEEDIRWCKSCCIHACWNLVYIGPMAKNLAPKTGFLGSRYLTSSMEF